MIADLSSHSHNSWSAKSSPVYQSSLVTFSSQKSSSQKVGRVRSPFHRPMTSPVSPTQSRTPLIAFFAIPAFVPLLCLLRPSTPVPAVPLPKAVVGSFPGLIKLLPSPVAYSEPIDGNTFSPADSETKSAKGTSQTHSPKYDAISVNVGIDGA